VTKRGSGRPESVILRNLRGGMTGKATTVFARIFILLN